jgi:hypothetical protein
MNRRDFLTLIGSAPLAALVPLPAVMEPLRAGDVFTIAGHYAVNPPGPTGLLLPFVTLPTTHEIVALVETDGYLCARTDDDTCWVIDRDGEIVSTFSR